MVFTNDQINAYTAQYPIRHDIEPIIIVGPSGIGKDWIAQMLAQFFHLVLSTTSRTMRKTDQNGEGYNFVSEEEFERLLLDHQMATGFFEDKLGGYYGYKGPDFDDAIAAGKIPLAIVYYKAIPDLLKIFPNAKIVLMMPSESEEALGFLRKRLLKRGESKESIERRLADAWRQIQETHQDGGAIKAMIGNGAILFEINCDEDANRVIEHLLAEVHGEVSSEKDEELLNLK